MSNEGKVPFGAERDPGPELRPWTRIGMIFIGGVMTFVVLLLLTRAFEYSRLRSDAITQAERENLAFVGIIERYARQTADGMSFVLGALDRRVGDADNNREVVQRIRDSAEQLVRVNADFIRVDAIDPSGVIIFSTDAQEVGTSFVDIGLLEKSRSTPAVVFGTAAPCNDCPGPYYFTAARRMTQSSGELQGTIVVRIDPRKLQALAGTLGESFSGLVRIALTDGTLIVSEPPQGKMPGTKIQPPRGTMADLDRSGRTVLLPWDYSKSVLIAYKYVPEYDFFVSFARGKDNILAGVTRAIWESVIFGLMTLIACGVASAMFYRMLRMRAIVSGRLSTSRAELENIQNASRITGFRWYPSTGRLAHTIDVRNVIDLGDAPQDGPPGVKNLLGVFPQDEAQALGDAIMDCLKTGAEHRLELTAARANPSTKVVPTYAITTFRSGNADKDGYHVFLVCQDITEWHDTRIQHSHLLKMEAVGQITGGVAHDFNNLLVVILGNIEEIAMEFSVDDPRHTLLDVTLGAAMQARDLTKRLLAFARKQTLQPSSIAIVSLVENMRSLLRRTIGEHIVLKMDVDQGMKPWNIRADRSQLETAILNLIINARDALPMGGNITVRVRNRVVTSHEVLGRDDLAPGEYVDIMVEDNGSGMSEDVAVRAIEPYFTTKPSGAGSGLGLSQVYGFVKQSGGHFRINSQEGVGTVIHMYLPRAEASLKEDGMPDAWDEGFEMGHETILVVEDDEAVRAHVDRVLTSLGYKVLSRIDGKAALALVEEGVQFDLLLTDVMLPGGMSGVQLAKRVKEIRPEMPVLYVSGYAKDMIDESGRTTADLHFLQKPFLKGELGKKVRAALGG